MNKIGLAGISIALTLAGTASHAAELIKDGNFERPLSTAWTKSGSGNAFEAFGPVNNILFARSGLLYAVINTPDGRSANNDVESLSQSFSDVAGDTYIVTAYVSTTAPARNRTSFWGIDIDGVQYVGSNPSITEGWTKEAFAFTGTGSDTITLFADNSSAGVFTEFDDVKVRGPAATVPEPASWTMLILGLGAVGAAVRQRRAGAMVAA
jgi:hypothetical protein